MRIVAHPVELILFGLPHPFCTEYTHTKNMTKQRTEEQLFYGKVVFVLYVRFIYSF